MNHIGSIVRELREGIGMSRRELCADICTEKYAYLIERGERTPSAEILRLMSVRLGQNLFDCFEFMDCLEPVRVHTLIERLDYCRYASRHEELRAAVAEAEELPDFARPPWVYELELNRMYHFVLTERRFAEGVARIAAAIAAIPPKYASGLYVAEMYMILSDCHFILGNWDAAAAALAAGEQLAGRGRGAFRGTEVRISLKFNRILMRILQKRDAEAVEECEKLYRFQIDNARFGRAHLTCILMACALLGLERDEQAIAWFQKGLHISLGLESGGLEMLGMSSRFWRLLGDERVPRALREELIARFRLASDDPRQFLTDHSPDKDTM